MNEESYFPFIPAPSNVVCSVPDGEVLNKEEHAGLHFPGSIGEVTGARDVAFDCDSCPAFSRLSQLHLTVTLNGITCLGFESLNNTDWQHIDLSRKTHQLGHDLKPACIALSLSHQLASM